MAKKKIVLVDDEVDFTQLVRRNVEQTGDYEVKIVNKSTEAVAACKEFKPDMILLDLLMPEMDGSEVVRQLKSHDDLKDIPILLLTALVAQNEQAIIDGRSYPSVPKPVSPEQLIKHIQKILIK